jgi:hypothetical protein
LKWIAYEKMCRSITFGNSSFHNPISRHFSGTIWNNFSDANLSQNVGAQVTMKETANDLKSFGKSSNYDSIYDLIKNQEIIGIREIKEDGIVTRKFTKYESIKDKKACKFVAKFELIRTNNKTIPANVTETCILLLKCEIYDLKSNKQAHLDKN